MTHAELPYWLALRRAGLGTVSFSRLIATFSTIEESWQADSADLKRAGLDTKYTRAFLKAKNTFEADRELSLLAKSGVTALTWLDEDYPSSLANILDSPPVIFVKGSCAPHQEFALAIVGTRSPTPYGREACEMFAGAMADAGFALVSGLARGIDSIAHRIALEHGVPTIAVLGGGIDEIYPREHLKLADQIVDAGCLVSEYPPGSRSRASHFPRRNRILSGLARATLVVEAGDSSGALHTANWAREQDREVFAIPGPISSKLSRGTNQLIRESTAKLVTTPVQLLEELNLAGARGQLALTPPAASGTAEEDPAGVPAPPEETTSDEGRLLHWLGDTARHVDELVRASGLAPQMVSSTLQMLELKGLVREESAMVYRRVS
jgi:DNA processing protein